MSGRVAASPVLPGNSWGNYSRSSTHPSDTSFFQGRSLVFLQELGSRSSFGESKWWERVFCELEE